MAQHFLLSAAARGLDFEQLLGMSDEEAHEVFKLARWPDTDGRPVCPRDGCGCDAVYEQRRLCPSRSKTPGKPPILRRLWKCKRCETQFSVTTGTPFASRKLPLKRILYFLALFADRPKGISSISLHHGIRCHYKTAWVMSQKIREVMRASQLNAGELGVAEIDATYTGGHVRKSNLVKHRKDRRRRDTKKQKCITVMVERGPNARSSVAVTRTDREAVPIIRARVKGPQIYTDEAASYKPLSLHYDVQRIDHTNEGYSVDGRCTNQAESFFARLKRGIKGTYHHISGSYTEHYAFEFSWRSDHRTTGAEGQFKLLTAQALAQPVSRDMKGYWQRRRAA